MNMPIPGLKEAMRNVPSTVALITSRDAEGTPHGMAASAVISITVDPPAVLVAVNRTAGIHPVLEMSGRLCINFLAKDQAHLLDAFSRSDLRAERFTQSDWRDVRGAGGKDLPWLPAARAVLFADVDQTMPYGTHTLFIARVREVVLPSSAATDAHPLVWLGGRSVPLATLGA
ncbi:flavin reductase family protein [Achromobacter denitrificans]|uniref:flavin reductase family protein n=1 Tax=Achromobacter denitrificans TaxID=32002 RepID=UPI001465DD33|nr:flavin reductase family protein [Achromobacter denitrificans]CAB3849828.1 4-hydroxyphenylacetate 3-monooxygenase reductase component [Achromobacter denitrificans]